MTQHILLGISGSVSAYKAPEIVRALKKNGHNVTCILTDAAKKFVTPFALENVSENTCYTDEHFWSEKNLHIHLSRQADALVIAPGSANTLSKLAKGFADNLLLNCALSIKGPVAIAPAMHTEMLENKVIEDNIQTLKTQGRFIIGPGSGDLLSGDTGLGRLIDPDDIANAVQCLGFDPLDLSQKKILITAGGTQEPIDPVRVIGNQSSGLLGKTLAELATLYQAQVTLISTKPQSSTGYALKTVQTGKQMASQVHAEMGSHDSLIMAAAVSDFIPAYSEQKIRRHKNQDLSLNLSPSEDILASVIQAYPDKHYTGFCLADPDTLEETAKQKCQQKNCQYIVANTAENLGSKTRSFKIMTATDTLGDFKHLSLQEAAYQILNFQH